jgi:hypothetical protein
VTGRASPFSVRLEFFREKHFGLSPPFIASGVMENKHFISSKTLEVLISSDPKPLSTAQTPPL